MPKYVTAAFHKFKHPASKRPQFAPYKHNQPQYGVKVQLTHPIDISPPATKLQRKRIQQVIGTFLYYACAVNGKAFVALSTLASQQSKATKSTVAATDQLMDYYATYPNASDMISKIHSNAGYLNKSEARSHAGGHFYLDNDENKPNIYNGAILNPTAGILKHVASSAMEAKVGALFVNTKEGKITYTTLKAMGRPQPATPVTTDNSTADGIMNDTIQCQGSCTIHMRYHWLRDRVAQKHFNVFWKPGSQNLGDYFTKHFSPAHQHKAMRPTYLAKGTPIRKAHDTGFHLSTAFTKWQPKYSLRFTLIF
jgi:hypothetical protein